MFTVPRRLRAVARLAAVAAIALSAAAAPALAQNRGAAACGADPVCLALVAKDYADCDAFRAGVAEGWYPAWATEQTGVCVETESGEVLYGFTGPTDKGAFEFFAMSAKGPENRGGAICRGSGVRSALAARDRTVLDGAASFACSDGRVGTAEFGAGGAGVEGGGRFLRGDAFTLSAFDMRGLAPSLFAAFAEALSKAAKASQKDRGISH